jgi:hypothetical protein
MKEAHSNFEIKNPKYRHVTMFLFCLAFAGCRTVPDTTPSARQQAEADLVLNFQSWRAISFIKPDVTGTANTMTFRSKTFTRDGMVKLLRNLKVNRDFVVVVLDRQYYPDPITAAGGMDEIQHFFQELGFHRIAFQDGAAWNHADGMPILRDTGGEKNSPRPG